MPSFGSLLHTFFCTASSLRIKAVPWPQLVSRVDHMHLLNGARGPAIHCKNMPRLLRQNDVTQLFRPLLVVNCVSQLAINNPISGKLGRVVAPRAGSSAQTSPASEIN